METEKLEIIIVTYNRCRYVQRTLDTFLDEHSPIRTCKITILDNNSNDGTAELAHNANSAHSNVKYRKNKYNLGIAGNIFRAMELAEREYVWIVGDDDTYDFSGWDDVASAMDRNEKVICLSRYTLPDKLKDDVAAQLVQITFVTGCIYSTTLFNDTTMRDAAYNVFNLFPHLIPVVHFVNAGGHIHVVRKAIADNGLLLGEEKDCSYNRGIRKVNDLSPRTQYMTWMVGWASVCQAVKDEATQKRMMIRGCECIHKSWREFFRFMFACYNKRSLFMLPAECYSVLPFLQGICLKMVMWWPVRIPLAKLRSSLIRLFCPK